MVKNPPANVPQEMRDRSLGWEDPLEKGMATHTSVLARRIPWTEEPGRLQFMGSYELDSTGRLNTSTFRNNNAALLLPVSAPPLMVSLLL